MTNYIVIESKNPFERGIQSAELHSGVRPSSIEALVDALLQENTKAVWH
jgi:hypothetical protein